MMAIWWYSRMFAGGEYRVVKEKAEKEVKQIEEFHLNTI
jgi:hypothetical protein